MKRSLIYTITLLAVCALPCAALANGEAAAKKEVATAIEHARYADEAPSVAVTHLHLHHVVNCLVGPHGKGFYPPAGDPCKGMGNGALNDAPRSSEMYGLILNALAIAHRGLAAQKLPAAHKAATEVINILESVGQPTHETKLTGKKPPAYL